MVDCQGRKRNSRGQGVGSGTDAPAGGEGEEGAGHIQLEYQADAFLRAYDFPAQPDHQSPLYLQLTVCDTFLHQVKP